jgi:hypothetical protein
MDLKMRYVGDIFISFLFIKICTKQTIRCVTKLMKNAKDALAFENKIYK